MTTPTVGGVVFNICEVQGVDLTTNAGWVTASTIYQTDVEFAATPDGTVPTTITAGGTSYTLDCVARTTTAAGIADLQDASIGLYLVYENLAATGDNVTVSGETGTVPKASLTPATPNPFFVTVPVTNPANTDWVYDVHAYPKNTSDSITKDVLDGNVGTENQDAPQVDDNLTYRLDHRAGHRLQR